MAGFANNPAERGAEGESSLARKYFHRSEHWVVVRGVAEVTISEDVRLYHENESPTCRSAGSTGSTIQARIPLELNGVQVGSYLGEDDILRLKDVDCRYARA